MTALVISLVIEALPGVIKSAALEKIFQLEHWLLELLNSLVPY
jgi:hypothetical protein